MCSFFVIFSNGITVSVAGFNYASTSCYPSDLPGITAYAIGDTAYICLVFNGVNYAVFTPRVDYYSALQVVGCKYLYD